MYIGSFWDEPWQHTGMQELMESDEVDLIEDLASLPENNAISKINEIARRCRLVQAHVHLLCELRAIVKAEWFSRKSRQEAILSSEQSFTDCMRTVQRKFDLSPGDFPAGADLHEFVTRLRAYDFADFYKPSAERSTKLKLLRELMEEDVPKLIARMHSVEQRNKQSKQQFSKFRPPRLVRPNRVPPTPGAGWDERAAATAAGAPIGGEAHAAGNVLEAFKQRAAEAVRNTLERAPGGAPPPSGPPSQAPSEWAAAQAAPDGVAAVQAIAPTELAEASELAALPEAVADCDAPDAAEQAWPAPTAADWPGPDGAPHVEPAQARTGFGGDDFEVAPSDVPTASVASAGMSAELGAGYPPQGSDASAAPYSPSGTPSDGSQSSGAGPGWQ